MTISPTTNKPFTTEDADRLLRLADQFLEDWAVDMVNDGKPDSDYEERNAEWKAIRPLFEQAPAMLEVIKGLIQQIEDDPESADFLIDAGCIECTAGTVPNHLNTGLCPYHKGKQVVAKAEGTR
ncbi:MAG: hypothetical protein BGO51_03765 [Rhodospirillales bacterium 69-11]|nr:hypothetical protein [Rhodospirillales bacterium]MBN8928030.1 hypothetical protein [Rhodospirillales bacterium]OJW28404.1 MAG: hypothetical protein BGO51_03765 [Rhodospirillales bacterium 69-11]